MVIEKELNHDELEQRANKYQQKEIRDGKIIKYILMNDSL